MLPVKAEGWWRDGGMDGWDGWVDSHEGCRCECTAGRRIAGAVQCSVCRVIIVCSIDRVSDFVPNDSVHAVLSAAVLKCPASSRPSVHSTTSSPRIAEQPGLAWQSSLTSSTFNTIIHPIRIPISISTLSVPALPTCDFSPRIVYRLQATAQSHAPPPWYAYSLLSVTIQSKQATNSSRVRTSPTCPAQVGHLAMGKTRKIQRYASPSSIRWPLCHCKQTASDKCAPL
jgi:hypothetical protein